MTMTNLIVKSLTYQYPAGRELVFSDFSCKGGENLLLLGQSGSGKTSLLHLLSGILTPATGCIAYGDVNLGNLSAGQRDHFRGKNIGMIFQKHFFIDGISVLENLKAACKLAGNQTDVMYLQKLLLSLEINHLANKKPSELSEGEQQRFSIARALANRPSWIMADEPTSSLDDTNCRNFVNLMNVTESDNPVSWIIATHDGRLKPYFSQIYNL
jgi:putative ABC transport system ATP-binding protein